MAIAHALMIAGLAANAGCLITGEPDHTPPDPTIPILIPQQPATNELLIFRGTAFPRVSFTVDIISEDGDIDKDLPGGDDDDELLRAVLLLDLGKATPLTEDEIQPYAGSVDSLPEIPKGTLEDLEPRPVTLGYLPSLSADKECHTITFQVFRTAMPEPEFKFCPNDKFFARLTWFVLLCEPNVVDGCDFDLCFTNEDGIDPAACPTPPTP